VQVIAGTGSNSTHEAVSLARAAEAAGADCAMAVVPYYNRPTQEGLRQHFLAIRARGLDSGDDLQRPVRTGMDISADTLVRIVEEAPNVWPPRRLPATCCARRSSCAGWARASRC